MRKKYKYDNIAYAIKNPGGFIIWTSLSVTKRTTIDWFLTNCNYRWEYYRDKKGYKVVKIGEVE